MKIHRKLAIDVQPTCKIDVTFNVLLDSDSEVAAATYRGHDVPEGKLPPSDAKLVVDSQAYADYQSFIETFEDALSDYYELEVYYKNKSKYGSFYYGMIAKNEDNTVIIDFDLSIRVSTHDAERTADSQRHKKERKAALLKVTQGKKTKPIVKSIVVNDSRFDSYMDAIEYVYTILDDAVSKMSRNGIK